MAGERAKMPRWLPGDRIYARQLNEIARSLDVYIQPPRALDDDLGETVFPPEIGTGGGGGVALQAFTIASESTNTVTSSDSPGVVIAKPWVLRGATASRTVGSPGEDQVILPSYSSETDVLAANVGEDVTGIAGVDWIDLNVNGRMWAEDTS